MFADADFVYTYSRVLADVSQVAREAGFRIPVALTEGAWAECVAWSADDTEKTGVPQDEDGHLWDVLWMASCAARRNRNTPTDRVAFEVFRVARGRRRATRCALVLHVGPGDAGKPVITVMLPDED